MTSPEETARRERHLARIAVQREQDAALAGDDTAAAAVRAAWEPIEQFVKEGPDVGEPEEAESEAGQRIN